MDRSHEYLDKIEEGIDRINASATRVKSVLRSKDDKIEMLTEHLNRSSAQLRQAEADLEGQRKVIEDLEATQARIHEANGNMRRQIDEANKTAEQFKTAAEQWKNRYWELRQLHSRENGLSLSTFNRTENAVGKAKELVEYLQETAQKANPHPF